VQIREPAETMIREYTRVGVAALVPEVRLWLAEELVPLWEATERRAAQPQAPPFWAFAWPGSQALARYVLDTPGVVGRKRVLDFGAGGGLAAIAAAQMGAVHVLACDIDPLALVAQRLNAALNGVTFESQCADLVDSELDVDIVLVGDVCYEREPSERIVSWLRDVTETGCDVLLADPGRHYAPAQGLDLLATYEVPTLKELESADSKRTRLWRLKPSQTDTWMRFALS
jgi:predicted nicotinamide N-methyase